MGNLINRLLQKYLQPMQINVTWNLLVCLVVPGHTHIRPMLLSWFFPSKNQNNHRSNLELRNRTETLFPVFKIFMRCSDFKNSCFRKKCFKRLPLNLSFLLKLKKILLRKLGGHKHYFMVNLFLLFPPLI